MFSDNVTDEFEMHYDPFKTFSSRLRHYCWVLRYVHTYKSVPLKLGSAAGVSQVATAGEQCVVQSNDEVYFVSCAGFF